MCRNQGARPVNRIFVYVGLIVVLALAASADAATTHRYRGPIAGGGTLRLKAEVSGGAIVKVRGIAWRRLAIHCHQGNFRFRGGFEREAFPVEGSAFHARGASGGQYVSHARVSGSFRKHGRRVAGTLRVRGALDAHHTGCHSGRRRWWAHRR